MKTEAEIKREIKRLQQAARRKTKRGSFNDLEEAWVMGFQVDELKWVIEEDK